MLHFGDSRKDENELMFSQEAHENEMSLEDDNPKAVRIMIRCLYGLGYKKDKSSTADDMLFLVDVFAIADKYDVPRLRKSVTIHFAELAKKKDFTRTNAFVECIKSACENAWADKSLERVILGICHEKLASVFQNQSFKDWLQTTTSFTLGYLEADLESNMRVKNIVGCKGCEKWMTIARWEGTNGNPLNECPNCELRDSCNGLSLYESEG